MKDCFAAQREFLENCTSRGNEQRVAYLDYMINVD